MYVLAQNMNIQKPMNGETPCEGPKGIFATLDFTAANAWQFDLTALWNNKQFTSLQTVYVDNTANTSTLVITTNTGQQITVPIGTGGYFPVCCLAPAKITFTSAGAFKIPVTLLNFYLPGQNWK